jgi:hypothetical protein
LVGDDGSVADPAEWHEESQHVAFAVVPIWHGRAEEEVEDPEGTDGVEDMEGLDEDEDMGGTDGVDDIEGVEGVDAMDGTEDMEACVLS